LEKVLFWDFDGTLIHPNESFLETLHLSLKSYKYEITAEDIRLFLHTACSWYNPEIAYVEETGQKWWDNFFKHTNSFLKIHKIKNTDIENINDMFKKGIMDFRNYKLYSDTKEVLYYCKKIGYKNYILSNNFPELPLIINDFGLSDYFTDYIVSSNVGYEKPKLEIFQCALRLANFPEVSYMIGDNPVADIQGGKAAGLKTILVHKDCISDADYSCKTLSEIPMLIEM
jgi:putative hydrolase of the HAD superfamily